MFKFDAHYAPNKLDLIYRLHFRLKAMIAKSTPFAINTRLATVPSIIDNCKELKAEVALVKFKFQPYCSS